MAKEFCEGKKERNNIDWRDFDYGVFLVTLQGIVYNPQTKRILIGKRCFDRYVSDVSWTFIGGRAHYSDLEKSMKKIIFKKTGLKAKIEKIVYAKTYLEQRQIISIYFLTTYQTGEPKSKDFTELKWIKPTDVVKYFTTSLHPKIMNFLKTLE